MEENSDTLKFYLKMALAANGVYYALALTVLNDCFTWLNIVSDQPIFLYSSFKFNFNYYLTNQTILSEILYYLIK